MPTSLEPVLPFLWLWRDAVNVYVLQWENGRTCLFDLGSGAVLSAMEQAGLPRPDLVLHTDYRRDRTFGHYDHPGLRVAIGAGDAPFMADAEALWASLQVDHGYGGYEHFWMPRQSIPVEQRLGDGQLVVWEKPYIYAQALSAHTPGGMGYLIVHGGKRYLVCGDILQADGTLHSIFELQRTYNFMEGLHALRRAAGWLASGDVEGVFPSHGEPILGREAVQRAAQTLLGRIADFWERWRLIWPDQPQGEVTDFDPVALPAPGGTEKEPDAKAVRLPHLRGATNRFQYAIADDDGHALFFDAGVEYPEGFENLLATKGIQSVEYVIITHHHDDHVMGCDWLREHYGTRVAAHECMVDVLERPYAYALNCLHDKPVKVDTVLREGEPWQWRGYRIFPHHFPSQTEYHDVFFCQVDGQMVLFSGDAVYWEPGGQRIRPTNPDWRNRFNVDGGYLVGAHLLRRYQPRVLAAAHVRPWPIAPEACEEFEANARAFHDALRALIGRKHPTMGIDPFFISIYPYRAARAEAIQIEVRVDNPLPQPVHLSLTPRLPSGITTRPAALEVDLGPREHARLPLQLCVRSDTQIGRRAIWTLRVVIDGVDLGEFCEGMVEG